ncbi:MAG: serine/threonine protein kinase [Bacteroidales bacterium]|nr:serine/threonine protein kinase [Bacteroidales bacterium]
MLGPSGFFMTSGPGDSPITSDSLEIIHDSEDGFNVLYRGSKNGRFFVYKALKPEYRGDHIYEELLKKDFNIGFSLTHSNICQYYGMVDLPGIGNCIVMEWVDGCSLERLILDGKIDRPLARKLICEICDALDYMHRKQVVHRDLKPENILVTYNGQNVKIIDFGLSDGDSYNAFKAPAGTKVYASPELMAGEQIDGRSDIWSLGMVINEMTDAYGHVASKCLRRDRNLRFANAMQVKTAMQNAGRRLFARFLVSVITIMVILTSAFLLRDLWVSMGNDALEQKEEIFPEEPVLPTVEEVVSAEEPLRPVSPRKDTVKTKVSEESIDASDLDDLFNDALNQIL